MFQKHSHRYSRNPDFSNSLLCRAYEAGGVNLVTDDVSLEFIRGAKIDYSDELIKSAFEVGLHWPEADWSLLSMHWKRQIICRPLCYWSVHTYSQICMSSSTYSSSQHFQDLCLSSCMHLQVIDNPNADKGCGCGSSFSPK